MERYFEKMLRKAGLPAPDDTASPPHESDASVVEVPPKLLGGLPQQHEALGVRHNLARIQGLQKGEDLERFNEMKCSEASPGGWIPQRLSCLLSSGSETDP